MSNLTLEIDRPRAGVARVKMNRPDVYNAFDENMIAELDAAFEQLGADDQVRIVLLAAAGKHFSAGADLDWMKRASRASEEWNLEDARKLAAMLARIDSCPKPVVARVQGAALGGGVGLVCACDIAIAADNASFAVSEARFGILPATIGPYLLNAVGKRQARRLALTTERIRAAEAANIDLVHRVVAADELDDVIDSTLTDLLAGGPAAQREIKAYFADMAVGPITDAVRERSARTISRVRATDEAREGFDAFFAKRPAGWIPE